METWAFCETCTTWFECPHGVDGAVLDWHCPACLALPIAVEQRVAAEAGLS